MSGLLQVGQEPAVCLLSARLLSPAYAAGSFSNFSLQEGEQKKNVFPL
jgi:hypothetical protein